MEEKNMIEIINDLADLQDQIYDLSHSSADEVFKSINESHIIESKELFTEILLTIKKSIESRAKNLQDEYYLLIELLKNEIKKNFSSYELCYIIFINNEIRLKLLSYDLIDTKDIILLLKLYPKGSKKDSLIKLYFDYIQPYLSEILSEEELKSDDDDDNDYPDKNSRIPFLSNRITNDDLKDKNSVISLLSTKVPLTEKEKDYLTESIRKSIIEDDVDHFQFLVSSTNTFINQAISQIDFNNENISNRITLIDFAALNGSLKIFKFLIMNKSIVVNAETVVNAIKGGNYDILHIIESTDKGLFTSRFDVESYIEGAISWNQNQILDYLIDNYNYDLYQEHMKEGYFIKAIEHYNYDIFYRFITHFESPLNIITENSEPSVNLFNRSIDDSNKKLENIFKRIIYNKATQMFIVLFQDFNEDIKNKVRHQCMKAAFELKCKGVFEFLLQTDKIQRKEEETETETNFEYNFIFYKDDIDFMASADKDNFTDIHEILYLFNLIENNIKNDELKVAYFTKTNSSNKNVLHITARNNCTEILDFFIKKEPNQTDIAMINDYQDNTPLHIAAESHSTSFVKMLILYKEKFYADLKFIEHFNSKNYDGLTPFLLAVDRGCLEIVEFLKNVDEINLNARNNLNQNALQIAIENNRNKVFQFLILNTELIDSAPQNENFSRSIDFTNKDVNGQTLLHIASYKARVEMIKEIIQLKNVFKPSFLNERDNEKHTALHFAAYSGSVEIVNILLDFANLDSDDKLDVNAKGNENETPLHWAAENGFIDVVKILCEKGHADVNAIDDNGNTPKMRAEMRNFTDLVDYLSQLEK